MKRIAFSVATTLALGGTAFAGGDFQDYARVQNVTPQYDQVNAARSVNRSSSRKLPTAAPTPWSGRS